MEDVVTVAGTTAVTGVVLTPVAGDDIPKEKDGFTKPVVAVVSEEGVAVIVTTAEEYVGGSDSVFFSWPALSVAEAPPKLNGEVAGGLKTSVVAVEVVVAEVTAATVCDTLLPIGPAGNLKVTDVSGFLLVTNKSRVGAVIDCDVSEVCTLTGTVVELFPPRLNAKPPEGLDPDEGTSNFSPIVKGNPPALVVGGFEVASLAASAFMVTSF